MDLRELLNQHQNLHLRIPEGGVGALPSDEQEQWDADLKANLAAFTAALGGPDGLGNLTHVLMEAVIDHLHDERVLVRVAAWFEFLPPYILAASLGLGPQDGPELDLGGI
jgi:hypothetical protein